MAEHEHFEYLCALAASGQLSGREYVELKEHVAGCRDCQNAYDDFHKLLHWELPILVGQKATPQKVAARLLHDNKHWQCFVAKAREHGFDFSVEPEASQTVRDKIRGLSLPPISYRLASAVIVTILLLTGAILFSHWRKSAAGYSAASARIAILNEETAALRQENSELSEARVLLEKELAKARTQDAVRSSSYRTLEERLEQALAAWQNVSNEVETTKNAMGETSAKLQAAKQALSSMEQEFRRLRSVHSEDASVIATQEARIADLSQRLREQTEILKRERRLLVADRDIRDLMGARDLQIIDVYDIDGVGRRKESFGRVFYTKGKSLIFYAFDLEKPRLTTAKHSYQAWGQREGSTAPALSLGIFYMDNIKHRRWVLKFEDPEVLSKIDYLFVTVEPLGGREYPSGKKLLSASLRHQANHP